MAANLTQILNFKANFHQEFELFKKKTTFMLTMVDTLTLYDPGGGALKAPPPPIFCPHTLNFGATLLCVGDFSQKTV